jgi:low affinity Fe/Cu permease
MTFEKLTSFATVVFGNSLTFIAALCLVIFWFSNEKFYTQNIHDSIGEVILGITFLSLFIIQKTFNRFSASLHLKVNELVSSHDSASNAVMNADAKTEHELTKLSKEYTELALQVEEEQAELEEQKAELKEQKAELEESIEHQAPKQ